MIKNEWRLIQTDANIELMSDTLKINPITAQVLANRGLRSKKAAINFLSVNEVITHDGFLMKDMKKAAERILKASKSEKIIIYGDYDADGIMSTVILYKTLKSIGANVSYYIPHRQDEGYGLNSEAVKKLALDGVDLIITVDNGISAINEVNEANALGVDVIIVDHHEPRFELIGSTKTDIIPDAYAVVDPKQSECEYPFKEMCGAGIVLKLALIILGDNKENSKEHSKELADEFFVLAGIATLCDIVDLVDENRTIVKKALKILNKNKLINPGLGSLITLRGYLNKTIDTFTFGFVIGPCLNAAGRLDKADIAVELLLSDSDTKKRLEMADKLVFYNDKRKHLTTECAERVLESLSKPYDKVLVVTDTKAHESVAGIVAGRVKEATHRPTILITCGDGAMKGSGRSIPNYNMFEALMKNKDLFERFGGHAMAAGLTILEENIDVLRERLNKTCELSEEAFIPVIEIDKEITFTEINFELVRELGAMAPYGKSNEEPTFSAYNLYTENVKMIPEKNTLIFTFSQNGKRFKAVAFGLNSKFDELNIKAKGGFYLDAAFHIELNLWNNNEEIQLRLKDIELSNN